MKGQVNDKGRAREAPESILFFHTFTHSFMGQVALELGLGKRKALKTGEEGIEIFSGGSARTDDVEVEK